MSVEVERQVESVKALVEEGLENARQARKFDQKLGWDTHYPKKCREVREELRYSVKLLHRVLRKHAVDLEVSIEGIYQDLVKAETLEEYSTAMKFMEDLLEDVEIELQQIEGPIRMELSEEDVGSVGERVRASILDDVDELNRCSGVEAWKAVCMLAGRIVESLFVHMIKLYVENGGEASSAQKIVRAIENHDTKQLGYQRLKEAMEDAGLLDTSSLTDNYFELIMAGRHPSVHFRDRETEIEIDQNVAQVVVPSTIVLIENVIRRATERGFLDHVSLEMSRERVGESTEYTQTRY